MKKILIITPSFPPCEGTGGVARIVRFAKYLPGFNWKPIILTMDRRPNFKDYSLLKGIDVGVKVYRAKGKLTNLLEKIFKRAKADQPNFKKTKSSSLIKRAIKKIEWFFVRLFLFSDKTLVWLPPLLKQARELIKKEDVDIIFTSSPPHFFQFIGLKLKKEYKIPWITDFRDGWTSWAYWEPLTWLHAKIERNIEKEVIENADHVISATELITDYFVKRYKKGKIDTITNGFDPFYFGKNNELYKKNKKFTIVHTGSLQKKQTAEHFYKAISELIQERRIDSKMLNIVFYGRVTSQELLLIRQYGLEKTIRCVGYRTYKDICKIISRSDILFLTIYKGKGSKAIYTGKIFNYIAAQRPILATIPNGVAKDLILKEKLGLVADPEDTSQIKKTILEFYKRWRDGRLEIDYNPDLIKKFNGKYLTEKLSYILDQYLN